jgi:exonuclease III
MNSSRNKYNKSNFRIANNSESSCISHQNLERIRNRTNFIRNFNRNNNNNNNYNNINQNNTNQIQQITNPTNTSPNSLPSLLSLESCISCINSRFASIDSSPSLEDTSNTISFATLNVRCLTNPSKFDAILEDLTGDSISIIGLQETRLKESAAIPLFKNFWVKRIKEFDYIAKWDFNHLDSHSGVALIIKANIAKYIQKVHKHKGRFIAVDLLLSCRKLKIINVYCHVANNYDSQGKPIIKFIIDHIKKAEQQGFECIILGDFNADPFHYHNALAKGRTIPKHLELVEFLFERNYIEQHPKIKDTLTFATYYREHVPCSRLPY